MDLLTSLVLLQAVNTAAILLAFWMGKLSKVEKLLRWLRGRDDQ